VVAVVRRGLLATAVVLFGSGCLTVYQPLSGLHEPVAIDTSFANLEGLGVGLRCVDGGPLDRSEAEDLCLKVSKVLENQGAVVRIHKEGRLPGEEGFDGEAATPPALNLRLSARMLHEEESSFLFWSWLDDYTFAQDLVIRDEAGFLLIQDTLVGRFQRQINWNNDDGDTAAKEFTADFYRQVNQRTLNARMRRQLLREGRP